MLAAKVRGYVTVPQDLDRVRHLGFESDDVSPLRGSETCVGILSPHTNVRGPDFGEDSPILDFYTQTFKKWQ